MDAWSPAAVLAMLVALCSVARNYPIGPEYFSGINEFRKSLSGFPDFLGCSL